MSRIGYAPIAVPLGVQIVITEDHLEAKGAKGESSLSFSQHVTFEIEDKVLYVKPTEDSRMARMRHGLYRSLAFNLIKGISEGFEKRLKMVGVGFKAEVQKEVVIFYLGYSSPIYFAIPQDVSIKIEEGTKIVVSGISKQRVGEIAAQIRSLRKPEPYKGKGILYVDEKIVRKEGKSGKK